MEDRDIQKHVGVRGKTESYAYAQGKTLAQKDHLRLISWLNVNLDTLTELNAKTRRSAVLFCLLSSRLPKKSLPKHSGTQSEEQRLQ